MALTYDQISAITEKKWIPKLVDNIFQATPLMQRLSKKIKLLDGGTKVLQPLNYAQGSSGGWYSGPDTLNNNDNDVITAAEFDWCQIYQSISISRKDELKNSGDAAKLKFVQSKVEIAEKTIKDNVATALFNAGTDPKAILGARTFVSTSNTYGGISQSTYSWHQSNVDATTTTLTLPAMQTLWGSCAINGDTPSLLIGTQANYNRFWGLLQPQQRFTSDKSVSAGFTSLMFNQAEFFADSKAPTGYLFYINEDYLNLYMHKDENFRFDPFDSPLNQNIKVAHVFAMMVLASSNNRMHGGFTAITG